MGMVVRTNMAAIGANNALASASKSQQSGMTKLYTGLKINSAKDDASGLAITEKMKNQIKALDTAKDNCEDGSNMIQTAEGYMKETHDILTRMTELAEKAANGVLKDEDRDALQNEMDQLCGEIDRMASTANFNGVKLMDGSLGSKSAVKVTCTADDGFKTESPSDAVNQFGGGVIEGGTLESGKKYAVTEKAEDNETDFKSVTLTVKELALDDKTPLESGSDITITVSAQKGDVFTVGDDGKATSAQGLEFDLGANSVLKGQTFRFDGDKWSTAKGDVLSTDLNNTGDIKMNISSDANKANESFKYTEKIEEGINLQIGDSSTSADRLTVSINSFHSDALFSGLNGLVNKTNDNDDTEATATIKIKNENASSTYEKAVSIDITDKDAASAAADGIRQIANYVSDERGKLGAQQNRLEHTVNNLTTASENTTAAKSRILDTDMAKEMMEYTSKNVIAQAAQSMLAQANSQPQNVLSLLQ